MSNNLILKTTNINKAFQIRKNFFTDTATTNIKAVENVSIVLEKGKILGIAGESGSGKTTFAKIIAGLMLQDSGVVMIDNKNILDYSTVDLATKVQMIFQDPFSSLNPKLSIGTIVTEAIKTKNKNALELASEILKTVGLPNDSIKQYPHQFSGGQRQRIAIARALASVPQIIIADEPVSSLDVSVQSQIINLFLDLKDKLGLSYIIISHDLNLLGTISDEIAIMQYGKIVEYGNSQEIINNPKNSYTQKLISAIPKINELN
jgi:ABC-type glutathione transport system ATPase component